LYSIGVILLKTDKIELFRTFLNDTLPNVRILSLPSTAYRPLADSAERFHLDFDDADQYTIAKEFQLKIATMDQHFRSVDDLETIFI
jgi:predicted nucleic acid-binding protein